MTSNEQTEVNLQFSAKASVFATDTPIRSPVNEPGPIETETRSICDARILLAASRLSILGIRQLVLG